MATLSLSELKKRPGRIATFVSKLTLKQPFDLVNGTKKTFTSLSYSSTGKVTTFTPSKSKGEAQKAIDYLTTEAKSADKIFVSAGNEQVSLSQLLKSSDFGGSGGSASGAVSGNRGDMAEAIFGAAITARFMNKNQPVTAVHVWALIGKIDNTKKQQKMVYDSLNKNPKIFDSITFQLGLAVPNLVALTTPSVQATLGDIVAAALKYANSPIVTSWSKLLYENDKHNNIEVIADGIGDQTGTKVDVRIKIDGVATNVNVSLKADDVKQFGQQSGASFETQLVLWKNLLNIDVASAEQAYYAKVKSQDTIGALNVVYQAAVSKFNIAIASNRSKAIKDLSNGITYYATSNEADVTLVQLSKEEAVVYKFDNLASLIGKMPLKATLITNKATPEVVIKNDSEEILVGVRVKTENKPNGIYVRNYVEKGKLLTKLASFVAV
jgi:hypothetical protein